MDSSFPCDLDQCPAVVIPNELLVKIFSYLDIEDLYQRVSLVCHKWRDVATLPVLRTSLKLTTERVHLDIIEEIILVSPYLQKLDIHVIYSDGSNVLQQIALSCHRLRHLEYTGNAHKPGLLESIGKGCPMLEHLHIHSADMKLSDESFIHFRRLKFLNIDGLFHIVDRNLMSIANHCKFLQVLYCSTWDLNANDMSRLLEHQTLALRKLHLYNGQVTEDVWRKFALCKNLEYLSLEGEHLNSSQIQDFCKFPKLQSFALQQVTLDNMADLEELFQSGTLANLRRLALCFMNELTDKVVLTAANHCPKLTSFDLVCCPRVTEIGLLAVINKCSQLCELTITANGEIPNVFETLKHKLPHLTYLLIPGNEFAEHYPAAYKVCLELKQVRPNLLVGCC